MRLILRVTSLQLTSHRLISQLNGGCYKRSYQNTQQFCNVRRVGSTPFAVIVAIFTPYVSQPAEHVTELKKVSSNWADFHGEHFASPDRIGPVAGRHQLDVWRCGKGFVTYGWKNQYGERIQCASQKVLSWILCRMTSNFCFRHYRTTKQSRT